MHARISTTPRYSPESSVRRGVRQRAAAAYLLFRDAFGAASVTPVYRVGFVPGFKAIVSDFRSGRDTARLAQAGSAHAENGFPREK